MGEILDCTFFIPNPIYLANKKIFHQPRFLQNKKMSLTITTIWGLFTCFLKPSLDKSGPHHLRQGDVHEPTGAWRILCRSRHLDHLQLGHRGSLMIRAYENHWFPLIRPAIKPLFLGGDTLGGGWLSSHDLSIKCVEKNDQNIFPKWWFNCPIASMYGIFTYI